MLSIKPDKKIFLNRIVNYSLLALAVTTIIFIAIFVVKITNGVAQTVETPSHLIRLQIENGSLSDNAAEIIEIYFKNYYNNDIDIKIVEKNNFVQRKIDKSFIVSREKDKTSAEIFARSIGLSEENIIFKPLENNYNQVSVTLVLGDDFEQIIKIKEENKEL